MDYEHLLRAMFGNKYYGKASITYDLGGWKKIYLRIIDALEKAIDVNIDDTDSLHLNSLHQTCEQLRGDVKRAKTLEELHQQIIIDLVRLNFILIGDMPNNWMKTQVNRDEHYKLDSSRKIHYTQTLRQKVSLIFSLPESSLYASKLPKTRELIEKFMKLQQNHKKFLEWFKQTYPAIYMELF
jgi:hypothetical protein